MIPLLTVLQQLPLVKVASKFTCVVCKSFCIRSSTYLLYDFYHQDRNAYTFCSSVSGTQMYSLGLRKLITFRSVSDYHFCFCK